MYYKEACEMLGVNETDSLEDIRSKVKEMLKLIKGSYLDFNDYKVKFMIDDIMVHLIIYVKIMIEL